MGYMTADGYRMTYEDWDDDGVYTGFDFYPCENCLEDVYTEHLAKPKYCDECAANPEDIPKFQKWLKKLERVLVSKAGLSPESAKMTCEREPDEWIKHFRNGDTPEQAIKSLRPDAVPSKPENRG